MAAPVVQSSQSLSVLGTGSTTITKPSGLAVGDLMIACITHEYITAAGSSINTLSGWTSLQQLNQNRIVLSIQYKVADSSDVAASNFTFTHTNSNNSAGGIIRVDGFASGAIFGASELDSNNSPADANVSFTATSTPQVADSLCIAVYAGYADGGSPSAITVSSYASTPTVTFTEIFDVATDGGGDKSLVLAAAAGSYTGSTEFTAYSSVFSATPNRAELGVLMLINSPQNATGTNVLLSVSPTLFAPTTSAGTIGTNATFAISPNLPTQSGEALQPTPWTTITKS